MAPNAQNNITAQGTSLLAGTPPWPCCAARSLVTASQMTQRNTTPFHTPSPLQLVIEAVQQLQHALLGCSQPDDTVYHHTVHHPPTRPPARAARHQGGAAAAAYVPAGREDHQKVHREPHRREPGRPEWATVLCLSNGRYLRKLEWLPAIACFVDTSRAGPPRRTCAACC